jgi:hypothetical protein
LRVESVPKKAYTHFIGEEAETVGLNMRLLVSGQAVDPGDVRSIAYQALRERLPSGYRLIDADFEIGTVTEDDEAPGWFTVSVTGRGYAASQVDVGAAVELIRGKPVSDARAQLLADFPLAEPPEFTTWPEWPESLSWLERVPFLAVRIDVNVVPKASFASSGS